MINELFDTFKNLELQLKKLLNVAERKRKALINRDSNLLEECISNEEIILSEISNIENLRVGYLNALSKEMKIEDPKLLLETFSDVLKNNLQVQIAKNFQSTRQNIKNTTSQIKTINEQNLALIENSRSFFRMLFSQLNGNKKSLLVNQKV